MNNEISPQEMIDSISQNYMQQIANLTLENAQLKIINKKLGEQNKELSKDSQNQNQNQNQN